MAKAKSSKNFFLGASHLIFSLDSAIPQNHNRSNGGVAFVFVKILGIELDFESVDSPKFSQVRNRIPQDKLSKPSDSPPKDALLRPPAKNFKVIQWRNFWKLKFIIIRHAKFARVKMRNNIVSP